MSTNNRMVEKSKKAIKDALLEIMYEKDFKQITVNELLKRVQCQPRHLLCALFKS